VGRELSTRTRGEASPLSFANTGRLEYSNGYGNFLKDQWEAFREEGRDQYEKLIGGEAARTLGCKRTSLYIQRGRKGKNDRRRGCVVSRLK